MARPTMSSVKVNRSNRALIDVTFDVNVGIGATSVTNRGFTLNFFRLDAATPTISSVAVSGAVATITLSRALTDGEIVVVSLSDTTGEIIESGGSLPADRANGFTNSQASMPYFLFIKEAFLGSALTTIVLTVSARNQTVIDLLQSGGIALTNLSGAFTVAATGGPTVSSRAQSGQLITLTLSAAVAAGVYPTVAAATISSVNDNSHDVVLETWTTLTCKDYQNIGNTKKRVGSVIRSGVSYNTL